MCHIVSAKTRYEIIMRGSDQLPIGRLARRVTSQTIISDYELRIHNFPPSLFWELSGDRGGCQDEMMSEAEEPHHKCSFVAVD